MLAIFQFHFDFSLIRLSFLSRFFFADAAFDVAAAAADFSPLPLHYASRCCCHDAAAFHIADISLIDFRCFLQTVTLAFDIAY